MLFYHYCPLLPIPVRIPLSGFQSTRTITPVHCTDVRRKIDVCTINTMPVHSTTFRRFPSCTHLFHIRYCLQATESHHPTSNCNRRYSNSASQPTSILDPKPSHPINPAYRYVRIKTIRNSPCTLHGWLRVHTLHGFRQEKRLIRHPKETESYSSM